MKSAERTQRVKTFSEEHYDSSQAGKSEMPDNIVSLVNKRLTIYYLRTWEKNISPGGQGHRVAPFTVL